MNTDDRLDRLTTRHEALTQTVELIAGMIRDLTRDVEKLTQNSQRDAENIRALARVAEIH